MKVPTREPGPSIDEKLAEKEKEHRLQVSIQWLRIELWGFLERPESMEAIHSRLADYQRDWIRSAHAALMDAKANQPAVAGDDGKGE